MAKARKPHTTKTERHAILKAAAKRKPKDGKPKKTEKGGKQKTPLKTPPWKASRKKRKPEPEPILITRKPRGPDLKPRKKRSDAMATSKREGEDDVKDVRGAKGADYAATTTEGGTGGTGGTGATGATGPAVEYVTVYDASSGQTKQMAKP